MKIYTIIFIFAIFEMNEAYNRFSLLPLSVSKLKSIFNDLNQNGTMKNEPKHAGIFEIEK